MLEGVAELVLGLSTSHLAMITRSPDLAEPEQLETLRQGFGRLARTLEEAEPDVLLLASGEHLNKFFLDNLPAFCIGVFDEFEGPVEANVGVPHRKVPSDRSLSMYLLERGLETGVDWARTEQWEVDHGMMLPLFFLDVRGRLPVVPLHINCAAPPYPSFARCFALGQWLAESVRAWPDAKRVAIVAAGGLSQALGRESAGRIDESFDRRFLEGLESAEEEALISIDEAGVEAGGSSIAEVRSWILLAGAFAGKPFERVLYEPVAGWATGCAQCIVR